jgi:hypothetical protein
VLLNRAGPALLANSMCPGQDIPTDHKPEIVIWESVYQATNLPENGI